MADLSITPATESDTELLADLIQEVETYYESNDIEPRDERIANTRMHLFGDHPIATVLLARDDNSNVLGMASYSLLWPASGTRCQLFLTELYVRDEHRGNGVGRALLNRLVEIAQEHNAMRVAWTARRNNVAAQSFYESLGYGADPNKTYHFIPLQAVDMPTMP